MINPNEVIDRHEWYESKIPRKEFRKLLKRDNYHGLINFGLWFFLLGATGYLAYEMIGSWLMIPAFILYGVIYNSNNSRWHECSHGTAFKTQWLNDFFYWLCGSMEFYDNINFRYSHTRHHSYTIISPIDPEEITPRPPTLLPLVLNFFSFFCIQA